MLPVLGWGQVSISTANTAVVQNFDGISNNTLPTDWSAIRYAGSGTLNQALTLSVTNGGSNSGGIYNVGTTSATDRALGTLASGSTVPRFGVAFINNTGTTVTDINLSGFMQQWRTGGNAVVEKIIFEYSLNASGINDAAGTTVWTPLPDMDLVEKLTTNNNNVAVDGNLPANKTSITGSISGLNFSNGSTI